MENHEQAQKDYACWCKEINEEMTKLGNMIKGLGPSDQVKDHFRNSRVEFLKGLRRMIDEKIERAQSHSSHGTTVPVE
jgi:hypothetical protein